MVAVPTGKADTLVVGAWVTDQTVIKEGRAAKRLADLKVGDRVPNSSNGSRSVNRGISTMPHEGEDNCRTSLDVDRRAKQPQ